MKQKDFVFILASTCILVIAWIGFTVYNAAVTSTINDATSMQISPIQPTFDTKTLENLKARLAIPPDYSGGVVPSASVSATPSFLATNAAKLTQPAR